MTTDFSATRSTLVHDAAAIDVALSRMAEAIDEAYKDASEILLLPVMVGGMIPASLLSLRLRTPLKIDYIHATRYRGQTQGSDRIDWLHWPKANLAGRHVLIVDDIVDEGVTLQAIIQRLCDENVASVRTAAVVVKQHERRVTGLRIDFSGLKVPDRYVFGLGMDYAERYRNIMEIRALFEPEGDL